MKAAAIYARVSSEQQKEENTIASQTAALVDFAREQGYSVPDNWVIEDEGFSGASLLRPGLERLRDLAAEGYIQAVLIHSPDRLSRKYAYQVLLTEEFARHGVETIFLKAPHSGTPEDQLMLQFQGMIAEYERAQILERSRRGKRHRAKAGEVSVLGGAPYGYRYIRKTSEASARYETDAAEAEVVRLVYDKYTVGGLSIGAIARLLRGMGVPTRRRVRWERSVVWAILRNPAYKGTACFNKTQIGPRQKVTKPFRLSGRAVHGDKSSSHERPRDEWIEIPVPAIVSEETFALAAERLADNKRFAPRRTIEPSIVQGLVSCRKCGYALSRSSTRSLAAPGEELPASDDDIDVGGVELKTVAGAARHFGRDQRRARAKKRIINCLAWPGVVVDRAAHALDRFLRAVAPALLALLVAERIVIGDLPDGRLRAVPLPLAALTLAHRVPTGFMLPVIIAAAQRKVLFGPDDLSPQQQPAGGEVPSDDIAV